MQCVLHATHLQCLRSFGCVSMTSHPHCKVAAIIQIVRTVPQCFTQFGPLLEVPVVTGEADIPLYLIPRLVLHITLEAGYRVLVRS